MKTKKKSNKRAKKLREMDYAVMATSERVENLTRQSKLRYQIDYRIALWHRDAVADALSVIILPFIQSFGGEDLGVHIRSIVAGVTTNFD